MATAEVAENNKNNNGGGSSRSISSSRDIVFQNRKLFSEFVEVYVHIIIIMTSTIRFAFFNAVYADRGDIPDRRTMRNSVIIPQERPYHLSPT